MPMQYYAVPASNTRIWEAAKLKGEYRISYADAFAIALAKEINGELVTREPEIVEVCTSGHFLLDQIPLETG